MLHCVSLRQTSQTLTVMTYWRQLAVPWLHSTLLCHKSDVRTRKTWFMLPSGESLGYLNCTILTRRHFQILRTSILGVSTFRDRPFSFHCFDISWLVRMNRDEKTWLTTSVSRTLLLLQRAVSHSSFKPWLSLLIVFVLYGTRLSLGLKKKLFALYRQYVCAFCAFWDYFIFLLLVLFTFFLATNRILHWKQYPMFVRVLSVMVSHKYRDTTVSTEHTWFLLAHLVAHFCGK